MYILAFDTTSQLGSVALIDELGNIVEKTTSDKMNHLKHLMNMTDSLMDESNISINDVMAIACSIGPGSFTGIRIGVSSARAIAQALSLPCISIPTLDSFRLFASLQPTENLNLADNQGDNIAYAQAQKLESHSATCIILNARRRQVYGAIFHNQIMDTPIAYHDENDHSIKYNSDKNTPLSKQLIDEDFLPPRQYMIEDIVSKLNNSDIKHVYFYGDGIDAYEDIIIETMQKSYTFAPLSERYQRSSLIARCALKKWTSGETISYFDLMPDYMRETEAETNLKSGELDRRRARKQLL